MFALVVFLALIGAFHATAVVTNDLICSVPTKWLTEAEVNRRLGVAANNNGELVYSAKFWLNINTNTTDTPNWFTVAEWNGISQQSYDSNLGTSTGAYYVNNGTAFNLGSPPWIFNFERPNSYCLTGDNTTGYITGSIINSDFYADAFFKNDILSPAGIMKKGYTFQYELFKFVSRDKTRYSYKIIVWNTTSVDEEPIEMIDMVYRKYPVSTKRSVDDVEETPIAPYNGPVHVVGRLRIPQYVFPREHWHRISWTT